ncbi:sigma-70 family RNA polymerase sigma factor [Jeotgalibacillus sp. R-1-5s-1]|uniref:sigma-70 family RNA polymerase sigma factor n=1 Tax=Jeotgalibacillus sp. R-1-5s-1 TaxID=2555897 RepID=UPI00106C3997|nr:sigma-70 family RNA polymerase sigma factor [Jeotgalibacillus sp. R-1-5s-1]TFD97073.1 sigma-70 family RNA polymerase sigma factor [Jeotgalibacillus sp. R-1-5s-1]
MTFEERYEQFQPMIFHMMRKLNIRRDRDLYEQEGRIALWKATQRYTPENGEFAPFAYQLIRGHMLDLMRKENKIAERETVKSDEYWQMNLEAIHDRLLEIDMLLPYAELLTEHQKKWFWHTFIDELTVTEIAELHQVSISAVKKWKGGALKRLRE